MTSKPPRTPPLRLTGRDDLLEQARIQIERTRRRLSAQPLLVIGPRGARMTALLDAMQEDAMATGICTIRVDADEKRPLSADLIPELHQALLQLSGNNAAEAQARRALRMLARSVKSAKRKYENFEVSIPSESEDELPDFDDLEADLPAILGAAGEAAAKANTAIAMFIDELDYVCGHQLAALIVALHQLSQRSLPVTLVGAGLPSLRANVGEAKPYAERMFSFAEILAW